MDGQDFPHLFAPGRIGTMELRNRIVSCPMGDRLANPDGSVSDAHLSYFEARARGGAALVLLGSVCVTYPGGAYAYEQMALAHDGHVPGYRALAARVHAQGAKVAAQLVHNGSTALNDMVVGRPLLVPSIPKAKGRDRLSGMVTAPEAAAMSQAMTAPGFAVRYQKATEEDIERVIDWFATAAARCVEAGLDGVELHAGHGYLFDEFLSPASNTRTDRWGGPVENRARLLCEAVREIRRRLGPDLPLWARINAFEAHREGGTTRFVAMGRKLLADPDLPKKLAAGHEDDVRPCLYQYRCIGNISVGRGVRCVVNPATGRENEVPPLEGLVPRRVLVVGGGPAGLEAARLLAHDGHEVVLLEASGSLGGQLALAATVEEPLARLHRWLIRQVEGLPVDVHLDRRATLDDCLAGGFDLVVVATGGAPSLADPPAGARGVEDLTDWLRTDGDEVGARVAVIGGERGAIAVARLCAARGRTVQVLAPTSVFASDMGLPGRFRVVHDAEHAGVSFVPNADVGAIDADTVIVVDPVVPRRELLDELVAAGVDARAVGDCAGASSPERERGGLEAAFADVAAIVADLRRVATTSTGGGPRS